MEFERDAVLRVVKATRSAMKMAEAMQQLVTGNNCGTVADEIAGFLQDALFIASHDKSTGSFDTSTTMRLLTGDFDDGAVADWFAMMARMDERLTAIKKEETAQPKPNTFSREEFKDTLHRNGGYMTPEGEWEK